MPRLPPTLDRSGADSTLKQGDDFTDNVKKTLGDFLRAQVDDPDVGKKNSDDRQFVDQTTLANVDNTTFFHLLEGSDFNTFRNSLDKNIESGIGQQDILAAVDGFAGGATPTDDEATQPTPEAAAIVGGVSKVLAQNRFNPTSTFGDQFNDDGHIAVMPTALGSFDPDGASVNLGALKKIGLSLMLRATGEFIDGDPTSPGVSLGSLLPGQAQLGVKVDASSLEAENVFGAPGRDPGAGRPRQRIKDVRKGNVGEHSRSYGQLNSANEPFDGFLPLGMSALAIILVVALRLIATGLVRLLGLIAGKPMGPAGGKLAVDPLSYGSYGKQTSKNPLIPITLADIGIIELDRDFLACVDEGLTVFFSFDGDSFGRIARSPGFYANMVRVIIQSAARIINEVVDAFKTLAGGNVVAGAQAVLGIVGILKTSKVIAFLNIMAVLGDRSFARQDAGVDDAPRRSVVDGIPVTEASRIMKSREQRTGRLAWRGNAPVSMLLLPKEFKSAAAKFKQSTVEYIIARSNLVQELGDDGTEITDEPEGGRYSADDVLEIERRLDAEYVPFYFHDLRTNEIISFHAFMNSVDESFSPSYGESNPYGRIDPIMTYGNTRREFSLTFHVVSTSPDDFDDMYIKLNKLSTLLYPQFTRGRVVVDQDGNQFVQPFSQIPGASPLCRIRLGNLMKSNFSNVALARLFGLGADDFLDKNPEKVDTSATTLRLEQVKKQVEQFGWSPPMVAGLSDAGIKLFNERGGLLPPALAAISDTELIRNFQRVATRDARVKVKLPSVIKKSWRGEEQRVVGVSFDEPGLEDVTLDVPEYTLRIVKETLDPPIPIPETPALADTQADFFKSENNSIVRSFQNTRGKGLAGFITSLSIDWNEADGRWDVERFEARAPQLCKIDLSFTVIHDIPPGLDSTGMNRAPIWPTGRTLQRAYGDVYDSEGAGEARFKDSYAKIKGKV